MSSQVHIKNAYASEVIMEESEVERIYYGRKGCYDREIILLEAYEISEHNKKCINDFHTYLLRKASRYRVAKVSSQLRRICTLMGDKPLDQLTKSDINDFIRQLATAKKLKLVRDKKTKKLHYEQSDDPFSDNTRNDYIRTIKQYMYSIENGDLVKGIQQKKIRRNDLIRHVISEEEIRTVLQTITNVRDQALIITLHETGARAAEFLSIRIGDVKKAEDIWRLRVNGKTGERNIPILNSIPYLSQWLMQHPEKDNSNAYLWVGEYTRGRYKPLRYVGFCKVLKKCFNGMSKKVNPHNFRHSRATILARGLNEVQLCLYMGWEVGRTKMVATYVHASGRDLDDAFLTMHGKKTKEEEISINHPKTCLVCAETNGCTSRFCKRCGKPLSLAIAIQTEDNVKKTTNQLFQFLTEISQKPDVMQQFLEFQKNYNEKKVEE